MTRQGYVEQRTALINRVRGLLPELGIVLAQKADTIRREFGKLLEDLPGHCNTVVADAITEIVIHRRRARAATGTATGRGTSGRWRGWRYGGG